MPNVFVGKGIVENLVDDIVSEIQEGYLFTRYHQQPRRKVAYEIAKDYSLLYHPEANSVQVLQHLSL